MDKEISKSEQDRKKKKRYFKIVLFVAAAACLFFLTRYLLQRRAEASRFLIATVENGDIQNSITASGTVIPAFERVINAPVNTEIARVVLHRGDAVTAGSLIMELDKAYTQLEYEKLKDELELRRNSIDRQKLEFDKDLTDIDLRQQLKSLQISEIEAEIKDQKKLNRIGGATNEEVERAELNLRQAAIEQKMLINELQFKRKANIPDKKNLELEYQIQAKRLTELKKKLSETSVFAPAAGVITWINEDIGKTVSMGEPLVKIADLNAYKIEASVSDRNSQYVSVGAPVQVRINQEMLNGEITSILPAVENNTIQFIIELAENKSKALKPNLRVEVFIVTGRLTQVLKIRNGEAFNGASTQDVFFVEGDKAVRRKITKGMSGADEVQIVSGAKAGDRIIISDVRDYENLDQIILK